MHVYTVCKSQPSVTLGSVVLSFPAKWDGKLIVHADWFTAYEYSCLSSLLAAGEVLQDTSGPKQQKFHTDDINQYIYD